MRETFVGTEAHITQRNDVRGRPSPSPASRVTHVKLHVFEAAPVRTKRTPNQAYSINPCIK